MRGIAIGTKMQLCISIPDDFVSQLSWRNYVMNEDETNKSEVARIKQQIAIEYQAASRVFTDFTATARHAYLTARQEKLGVCLEELTQHMSPEDAMQTFIQAQVETARKLTIGESPSGKTLADEPNAHPTNSYDETGGSSSGKTS
jgi:hypothetical protein